MPILANEDDVWPRDLLENPDLLDDPDRAWFCVYTRSRREKELMRHLRSREIAFYGPVIPKRYRSPAGRLRTSFIPLFPNYVFLFASERERQEAFHSNCMSSCSKVTEPDRLLQDLRQIYSVVCAGIPLTPEAKLETGNRVRVRSGPFAGHEGVVLRREGKTKLLLSINFLEQGVSMEIDEGLLEVV